MKNSNKSLGREQIQSRINFLEKQIDDLNHYLPQTYELLISELDYQRCELLQIDIDAAYAAINADSKEAMPL